MAERLSLPLLQHVIVVNVSAGTETRGTSNGACQGVKDPAYLCDINFVLIIEIKMCFYFAY